MQFKAQGVNTPVHAASCPAQDEDDIPPANDVEAKPYIPEQAGPLPTKQEPDRYVQVPPANNQPPPPQGPHPGVSWCY